MRKSVYVFLAILIAGFVAITLWKSQPASVGANETETMTMAEKERIQRFWATYRTATELRLTGRLEEAAETYREALALNDRHEDAWYYLGNMHLELGERAGALRAWERLRSLNPHSARAHAQLGDLHLCNPADTYFDVDSAETAFMRALSINKEESGPVLRLGQVALLRGDLDRAQYYFDAVIGSNFKNVEAYVLNSYVAWKRGDHGRAARLLAQAREHTEPAAPPEGVLGEGDTRPGTALQVSAHSKCRAFAPFVDAFVQTPATATDQPYRNLEHFLAQTRKGM